MSGVGAVRGAWRGACRLLGGPKKSAGLTPKMKTRVDARLLVAPRGATCWYGSTHASYGVRFSSTNSPQTGSMNSVPEIDVGGGLSPPRQLQIEQTGRAVPRHVRRQGRGGEARGHAAAAGRRSLLRSRRASACLRPRVCSACLRLRGCLGRVRRCACRVSCPASAANSWPSARRSRDTFSAARWAHALHAQLRLRLGGSR